MGDDPRDVPTSPTFYRLEASRLRRYFRSKLTSGEDAGDLVQEAFARLAGRQAGGVLLNPAAYLQRIARNLLIDRARRRAATPTIVNIDDEVGRCLAVAADQTADIELRDLMQAYEGAVEALPPRTREVFLLHRVGELGYGQIAARLGISNRTVEWHMGEALLRIRRTLDCR